MKLSDENIEKIGREVVEAANPRQLPGLESWARRMLEIRASTDSPLTKAKAAITASTDKELLRPLLQVAWTELKRIGWSERGLSARMAIGAALLALTVSGQGAGIAALGGAIGVPLFVVFAAGGALAGTIIAEIQKRK
jgi:hypothetical protein